MFGLPVRSLHAFHKRAGFRLVLPSGSVTVITHLLKIILTMHQKTISNVKGVIDHFGSVSVFPAAAAFFLPGVGIGSFTNASCTAAAQYPRSYVHLRLFHTSWITSTHYSLHWHVFLFNASLINKHVCCLVLTTSPAMIEVGNTHTEADLSTLSFQQRPPVTLCLLLNKKSCSFSCKQAFFLRGHEVNTCCGTH